MILLPTINNPIRPSCINTNAKPGKDRRFNVFPTMKMDRAAWLIVAMLTMVGDWIEFTKDDLAAFAKVNKYPWGNMSYDQGFEQLLEKPRPDREPFVVYVGYGFYRVTHTFVAFCFASAPAPEFVREIEPSSVP